MINKNGRSLAAFLEDDVFAGEKGTQMLPDAKDVEGFDAFIKRYTAGLAIERAAVDSL